MKTKVKEKLKEKKKKDYPTLATTVEERLSWNFDYWNITRLLSFEEELERVKKDCAEIKKAELPKQTEKRVAKIINAYNTRMAQEENAYAQGVVEGTWKRPIPMHRELKREEIVNMVKDQVEHEIAGPHGQAIDGVQKRITRLMKDISFGFNAQMVGSPTYSQMQIALPYPKSDIYSGKEKIPTKVQRYDPVYPGAWMFITRFPISRIGKGENNYYDKYLEEMTGQKCLFGSPGWVITFKKMVRDKDEQH